MALYNRIQIKNSPYPEVIDGLNLLDIGVEDIADDWVKHENTVRACLRGETEMTFERMQYFEEKLGEEMEILFPKKFKK